MSPLLRRLGRTRARADAEVAATEVLRAVEATLLRFGVRTPSALAADLVDVLEQRRDYGAQIEQVDRVLREHDHRLTDDLAADVARALRVEHGRHERLVRQSETFEAELIAVDEALAKAGADPTDDRVAAIRALTDPAHDEVAATMAAGADPPGELRALAGEMHRWAPDVNALRIRDRLLDAARVLDGTGLRAADGVVDARIVDADSIATAGGPVCSACGVRFPCPEHQPDACDVVDRSRAAWCSADLDGARCSRPAGHTEPCRSVDERPSVPVAQCRAHAEPIAGRCELVAGHPGQHEWAAV